MCTYFSFPSIEKSRCETANHYAADIAYRNNLYRMNCKLVGRDDSLENADKIFKENLQHVVHMYNSSIQKMKFQTKEGNKLKVEFIGGEVNSWFNIDMNKPVSPIGFLASIVLATSAAMGIIALSESRYR